LTSECQQVPDWIIQAKWNSVRVTNTAKVRFYEDANCSRFIPKPPVLDPSSASRTNGPCSNLEKAGIRPLSFKKE